MASPASCNYFVTGKPGQNKTAGRDAHRRSTRGFARASCRRAGDTSIAQEPSSPSLQALISRAERAGKGAPPVDAWNPPFCGDIDMAILADGRWTYLGTPIGRPALVRLFSTVLRKDEDGRTYLVTPVEKLGIRVEDAPFTAVEMDRAMRQGEPVVTFRTNVGDLVEAGPDHPLRFAIGPQGGFKPYLLVRGRLEARLTRALAFDLADHIERDAEDRPFVPSGGARFFLPRDALGPVEKDR